MPGRPRVPEPTARATSGTSARPAWLWQALAVLTVAAVAWFASDIFLRRSLGARIPAVPDLAGASEAVGAHILDADRAARADPGSANIVGELAIAYHASLFIREALAVYSLAEALAPTEWRWTYYRGLIHEERGEHDRALESFARVTSINPSAGLAWFRIGEIALKQGRDSQAQDAYKKAQAAPAAPPFLTAGVTTREAVPLSKYAEMGLARLSAEGVTQVSTRAYVPPADPLLDAVVARSRQSDLLLKHAALAARGGDRQWRAFVARRALEFNPQALDVLLEMASLMQDSGKPAEAIPFLERAEALAPGDHHPQVQHGRALTDLDRLDEAEAVLRRAIRVRDAAAEYNLANVLDRKGRWDEARVHYERSLAIDPFHARALNNLGSGLARRGQTAAALALLTRAVEAAPQNAEAHSNLGVAQLNAGRIAEATTALERSLALDPASADAHNNLGIALAQQGRFEDAAARFKQALTLKPDHRDARRNLEALKQR